MSAISNEGILYTCAGCGRQTTHLQQWVRRHDALLCPDCDVTLAPRSDELAIRLARAEQKWQRLWRRVEETLGKSA